MAITYSAQAGTTITTHVMNETLGSQTQQTGNNTVVVSDTLANAGNGQIGDGTNGLGDTYVGRRLIIDEGLSTEQVRECTGQAAGTGTTQILTVNRDWDTNPAATTDTIHVPYEPGDIEDGGAGGGINLNSKTGLFELSNELTIANTGGLELLPGQALESDDNGTTVNNYVQSGGRFYAGYDAGNEAYVNGAISTQYNNATGEPSWQIQSGGRVDVYDTLFWAQLVGQQFENANGSDGRYYRTKWLGLTDELHLFDSTVRDCSAVGKGATTDIIRVDAGTDIIGFVASNVDTLETASGDTTTETIELRGVIFAGVTDLITLVNNKTWNMINPVWSATTSSDFNDAAVTGSATINDRTSVDTVVQEADSTKLQDALVNIYENTQLADLVLELTTDVDGIAADSFIYQAHIWTTGTGATTTYGGHALQAGKWLYLPFVAAQSSTDKFDGTIVLSSDPNIVQTTQATAKSAGSTITWNEDTNPSSIIKYTGGTGTLSVGDTVTGGTSGADGVVTQIVDGDSVAGTVHLKTRDAVAFSGTESLSNGAGWSATYTASSQQDFSIWIDCQDLSLQTAYDYEAAIQNETTLTADGELIWEWCRSAQTQPIYATGSSFFTERSNGKGIFLVDAGAGSIDYMTDDAGGTYVPPASVTLTVTVVDDAGTPVVGARVRIETSSGGTLIAEGTTNASGVFTSAYTYTGNVGVLTKVRLKSYRFFRTSGTITASGLDVGATVQPNTIVDLP